MEQAFLIKDLLGRFGWSVKQVAHRLGRDASWVSHRLALVNDLPDDVLEAVRQGHFSIWAGTMDNTTKVSPLMGKRCATPSMRKAIKCTS